jgi:hypothetical protein
VAGLLLALHLLAALAFQFVPELHHEVHDDAETESHACLVTILQSGAVDMAVVSVAVAVLILVCFSLPSARPEFRPPSAAYRLLPGRAPPASA